MMKYQKDPIGGIFLKRGLFKGIKNDTLMCQTCKYTNTQIEHITKCQKDPTCGKFLKRGLFKDLKIMFPCAERTNTKIQIQKYANTVYDEVAERPNMWYIFEKRIFRCDCIS